MQIVLVINVYYYDVWNLFIVCVVEMDVFDDFIVFV